MINIKELRKIGKQLGVKRFSTLKIDQLQIAIDDRKKELQILLKKLQKEPDIFCKECALERLILEMAEQSKKEKNEKQKYIDNDMEIDVETGGIIRPCVDIYTKNVEYL